METKANRYSFLYKKKIWNVNRKHDYMHEKSISKNTVCSNGEIIALNNNFIATITNFVDQLHLLAKLKWRVPEKKTL